MIIGRGKEIFSTHDAARICRVTPMTVIRWIKEGKIPAFKTAGGHRRILRQDLDRFCRARGIPFVHDGELPMGRVLVVDAEPSVRDQVADAARAVDEALTIELAGDAFSAGRLIASFRPGLVFLDQRLAGVDSVDLVTRMARDPETAMIAMCVMSAAPSADLDRAFRARGATACIARPPAADAVGRVVRATFHLADPGATPAGVSVIVIDGDVGSARAMSQELERHVPGIRVAAFESCIDALLAIGAERPDAIIVDVGVTDLDCIEVIRRVQSSAGPRARPPTVIATADPANASLRAAVSAAGARDFLLKPVGIERLAALLPRGQAPTA